MVFEVNLMACCGKTGGKEQHHPAWILEGNQMSDVHTPQMSLAFPGTVQSVPTLAVGFRKMPLVCPDSKPLALCHSCVSRGFQGTDSLSLGPICNCLD